MSGKLSKSFLFLIAALVIGMTARHFYMTPNVSGGELAPNFKGQLHTGQDFQLTDLKGKYVLLDFWGSWCGPCLAENPKLVKLYQKYHGKSFKNAGDFEIVSVAVERNDARWKKAISKHNLGWPYHLLDLTTSFKFFNSEIVSLYGVANLPSKFLINEKGETIGVNQSVEEIDAFLEAELK